MTFDPLLPVALLVVVALGLFTVVVVGALRADGTARALWAGRALLVVAIIGALLRPGAGTMSADVANTELDVVFVVDLSGSANAEDWDGGEPRLEGMRADIAELAVEHAGARFALITFDSIGRYRLPFTTDASALDKALQLATPQPAYRSGGSSIGAGAALLEEVLAGAANQNPERMRVVYYLGDGETTLSVEPDSYADSAKSIQGGAVLGYGTERGGQMRDTDPYNEGRYITDRSGNIGVSVIDEAALQGIAADLGVDYQLRTADTEVERADVDPVRGEGAGERGGVTTFPLYWVSALVALSWLLVETWWLARAGRELASAKDDLE